jgi:DNA modification methylase
MTTILNGDCIAQMKTLEAKTIQTCVTSPPYFGLRDYGHDGQIGLEPTPEDFVAAMVAVFREVRRVLRDDGTLWLNLGDSYARSAGNEESKLASLHTMGVGQKKAHEAGAMRKGKNRPPKGLKQKDLIGIPWRVAFALQADGWYLRQDIIWNKPNPMPESVRDRCTKAHEYIFLLSKSPKYYYDNESIKVPVKQDWGTRNRKDGKYHNEGTGLQPHSGLEKSYEKANKRSVWTVTTKPYKGAHFATFPSALIEPCILAGSRPGDTVLDPFGGSGTTGAVAVKHGRSAILIELNPDYIPLIQERLDMAEPKLSNQPELFTL